MRGARHAFAADVVAVGRWNLCAQALEACRPTMAALREAAAVHAEVWERAHRLAQAGAVASPSSAKRPLPASSRPASPAPKRAYAPATAAPPAPSRAALSPASASRAPLAPARATAANVSRSPVASPAKYARTPEPRPASPRAAADVVRSPRESGALLVVQEQIQRDAARELSRLSRF